MERDRLIPRGMERETELHVAKIHSQMERGGIEGMLISSNVNIFYATGRFFRGYVWIGEGGSAIYFVMKPQIYADEENVFYIRKPEQIPDLLKERGVSIPARIGLEEDVMTYSDIMRLRKLFPDAEIVNGTGAIRGARMVKTPYEIEQMRIDGVHHVRVYSKIAGLYREGMTDVELQIAIERELRLEGCLGFARVAGNLMDINMGSVLAGDNADNPSPYEFAMGGAGKDPSLPGGANGSPIHRGETVMVDMNGSFNSYQTDMTRIWTLGGLPEMAYKANECSRRILRRLEEATRPGMEACELYFMAKEIAKADGLEEYFMGHAQQAGFIGHGVGIELNEQPPIAPRCKVILEENMTLALEPKFVIPGIGGIGVENTYVIRNEGLECITSFQEDIIEFQGA